MKLHLVIVSEIYSYCLSQSICPSWILAIQTWLNV